jgi:hypothetical protein
VATLALQEIGRALDGALALFIGRPAPAGAFDTSIGGFWRSFAAIVLVVPSFAVSIAAEARLSGAAELAAGLPPVEAGPALSDMAIQATSLLADWIALPLVLALIAGPLGVSGRYVPFVVVRNWASVVSAAVYALPALFFNLGLIGREAVLLLSLAVLVVVLRYQYRIIRIVLATPVAASLGLVVLDLVLGLVVAEAIGRLASG